MPISAGAREIQRAPAGPARSSPTAREQRARERRQSAASSRLSVSSWPHEAAPARCPARCGSRSPARAPWRGRAAGWRRWRSDQQHEPHGAEQHEQRGPDVADHLLRQRHGDRTCQPWSAAVDLRDTPYRSLPVSTPSPPAPLDRAPGFRRPIRSYTRALRIVQNWCPGCPVRSVPTPPSARPPLSSGCRKPRGMTR